MGGGSIGSIVGKVLVDSEGTITLPFNDLLSEETITLPVNDLLVGKNISEVLSTIVKREWSLRPYSLDKNNPTEEYIEFINLIEQMIRLKERNSVTSTDIQSWKNIDHISTRLPKLDNLRFTDINQGMWEFYTPDNQTDNRIQVDNPDSIRPRNPEDDIQNAKVAIDFGTSSTVVAIRKDGKDELLRIGLQEVDMNKNEITESDFENPTILEFLDMDTLLKAWHSEPYRPLVNWQSVHCSHEARNRFRQNDTDPVIVGSILARLKQWALRDAQQAKVKITDSSNQFEYEFDHLAELTPIKGQPLQISEDYPELDPIELYAWFLGMNINWRERGIFLKYYMTFPVAYPVDVKHKILASFRRGLQRSLPDGLLYSDRFSEFSVEELASEPSAFSASALRTLKIEPTTEGIAYAVFDFGGGTTDFDYGIYRLPNDEEYDEGWDDVIEHFGSSGDKFLGGENILENLAYLVYKYNQNVCREQNITFTKPLDADAFVGSERLISSTQASVTNTTIMMSKLRPLWEGNENQDNTNPVLKIRLLNRNGEHKECEFDLPIEVIYDYLYQRIEDGLINFFTAMKSSFENRLQKLPDEIHILLAGNSSRSHIVQKILGKQESSASEDVSTNFIKELENIFRVEEKDLIIEDKFTVNFNINTFEVNNNTANVGKSLELDDKGKLTVKENGEYVFEPSPQYNNQSFEFDCDVKLTSEEEMSILLKLALKNQMDIENIDGLPKFHIHLPLQSSKKNPYQANTKTGVALGLLKISPGESLKVVNYAQSDNTDSPFQFYVGSYRREIFQPAIHRGGDYGDWHELGRVRQGMFILAYTTQPQALNNASRGTQGLKEMNVEFSGENTKGKKVLGKIISPDSIEICLAPSIEQIDQASDKRVIQLSI